MYYETTDVYFLRVHATIVPGSQKDWSRIHREKRRGMSFQ